MALYSSQKKTIRCKRLYNFTERTILIYGSARSDWTKTLAVSHDGKVIVYGGPLKKPTALFCRYLSSSHTERAWDEGA